MIHCHVHVWHVCISTVTAKENMCLPLQYLINQWLVQGQYYYILDVAVGHNDWIAWLYTIIAIIWHTGMYFHENVMFVGILLSMQGYEIPFIPHTEGIITLFPKSIIQELQNEARDNSTPLYVAYLDAKSAFDTVWISSLMCKLHAAGINGDLWMLIDNLHTEVTSQIKWKGALSDKFNINQGVRQGGVLSTGEYKGFNNNLLFKLTSSLSGSRLGSIQCGAPTCADDIAVVADSPVDLQILLDIAAEYSHSEHYELQPAKCVVFPFNSTASLDWPWEILGHELPIVDTTTHIGVKRDRPSGGLLSTIDNNITKARGAAYSVLGAGFHGVSGLNPVTTTHVWQVYVLPVLTYGLELFNIPERLITKLETFQNKILKQLLGLTNGTPQCAILLLTWLPTIEVVLHLKVLGMLWNIINANYSIENSILLRQLAVKDWSSSSWLVYVRKLLSRYDLPTIYSLMDDLPSRRHWKRLVEKMVFRCSEDTMEQRLTLYTSLRFLHGEPYRIGTPHIIIDSVLPSVMDVRRSATKLRLVTGTYSLQANRPAFNQHFSPTCLLCKSEPETREHFICSCSALEKVRQSGLTELQEVLPPQYWCHVTDLRWPAATIIELSTPNGKRILSHYTICYWIRHTTTLLPVTQWTLY